MTDEQTKASARVLWGCSTARTLRAHWALAELGLDYEHRPIGPRTGETQTDEFTRLNPRQKIPLLQDGDLTLAESAAIVNYLAEKYGEPDDLMPAAGTEARARYDQWAFFVMMELDAHTLYIIRKHRDLAHLYGEAPAAIQTASEGFAKQSAVAELEFADGREFLLGGPLQRCGHPARQLPRLGSCLRRADRPAARGLPGASERPPGLRPGHAGKLLREARAAAAVSG